MTKIEEWRPVPGHPGYEASDLGRIRSLDRRLADGRPWRGRIMRVKLDGRGYLNVALSLGSRRAYRHAMLHRVICETFHGPAPTPDHEVAHGDGVKLNCRASNLRWATAKENAEDRDRHGRTAHPAGELHPMALLTGAAVVACRAAHAAGSSAAALARQYGVSKWTMFDAISGRTWGHVA